MKENIISLDQTDKIVELGFIYCLRNPSTNEIFYIGATESAPKDRLKGHYSHFKEYLKGERNLNKRFEYLENIWPEIAIIELLEIVQNDYLYKKEIEYITKYTKKYNLTNQTIGGEGGNTFTMQNSKSKKEISELIRNKQLGKKKPKGFAENLSKIHTGSGNPMVGTGKLGWVICFNLDEKPLKLMKYPFEITNYLNELYGINNSKKHKNASGNISKGIRKNVSKMCKSKNLIWKDFNICSKEIQDIVLTDYESNQK